MLHLILLIYFAILSTVSAGVLENTLAMLVVIFKLFVFLCLKTKISQNSAASQRKK